MTEKSTFLSRLAENTDAIIPTDFYDVRQETHPKAGWVPMYGFTGVVYIIATIVFALLYANEAKTTIQTTQITSYDMNGADGYTCQMISRVNAVYQETTDAEGDVYDASLQYTLVNVIQSQTECEQNLATAAPCSSPLSYFHGTTAEMFPTSSVPLGACAVFDDGATFLFIGSKITSYVASTGAYDESISFAIDLNAITSSLATLQDGNLVYLSRAPSATAQVYAAIPSENQFLYDTGLDGNQTILNDNLHNIYLIQNSTLMALDVYSNPVIASPVFTLDSNDSIVYAAVYNDGANLTVYYFTTLGGNNLYTYTSSDEEVVADDRGADSVRGVVVDGFNRPYLLRRTDGQDQYDVYYYIEDSSGHRVADILEGQASFAINPSGDRIMVTVPRGLNSPPRFGFVFPLANYEDDDSDVDLSSVQYVMEIANYGAGWMTCEAQTLNASDWDPSIPARYARSCNQNGLVGEVLFGDANYFCAKDAASFSVLAALPYCTSLYAPICTRVAALPPYSCTRTTHPGFFACLATAFANTSALVSLLVFFFALLLPKLTSRFPVIEHETRGSDFNRRVEEIEMKEKAATASNNSDGDGTAAAVSNPMV